MVTVLEKSDDLTSINDEAKSISQALSVVLADTFNLYLKTLNYHWNVEGSKFVAIHNLTEEHYKEMGSAVDNIAERIRMLGYYAPGSFKDFSKLTTLEEADAEGVDSIKLLKNLERDHMTMIGKLKEIAKTAEKNDDSPTVDILNERRNFHEQAAWMLRSLTK